DVDAVGQVADVVVEPREFHLEVLGAEADRPEDAEPAGPAHGGDDVAAVAEGEDRELDSELVAELGAHGRSPPGMRRSAARMPWRGPRPPPRHAPDRSRS